FELWNMEYGSSRKEGKRILRETESFEFLDDDGDLQSESENIYEKKRGEKRAKLRVKFTTKALDKANTIAIFEANDTSWNGHYREKQKFSVIQLHVNDNNASTPFKQGPNAIVFPTSLFTNTLLNGYVQRGEIEQTPLYSSRQGEYEFTSADRNYNAESDGASNWIDFTIIRGNISSTDAMQVLDLLLNCVVNETIDNSTSELIIETAQLYDYVSTKWNGTRAEETNLPADVLEFVPIVSNYKNSPQGDKPIKCESEDESSYEVKDSWLLLIPAVGVVLFYLKNKEAIDYYVGQAIGLVMSFVEFVIKIVMAVVDFLVMVILSWLEDYLWLLIRAALLVIIEILFTLFIAGMTLLFATFLKSLNFITLIYGGSLILDGFSLEYIKFNQKLQILLEVSWNYRLSLKLDIPKSTFSVKVNSDSIFKIHSDIIDSSHETKLYPPLSLISNTPNDLSKNLNTLSLMNQETNPETSGELSYDHDWVTETDYGSFIVGGGWDDENECISDDDGDKIPFLYDRYKNNETKWDIYEDNSTNSDDDGDGIPDIYEEGNNTHYLTPDSDFDGLLDGWELEHADDFDDDYPLDPSKPDIIIEVDYVGDNKPNDKETEELWLAINQFCYTIADVCANLTNVFTYTFPMAAPFCALCGVFFLVYGLYIESQRPREPFEPLMKYFRECGINLIIIRDEKNLDGDGINYTPGQCNSIENNHHDIEEAIYALFIYTLNKEGESIPGTSGEKFGIINAIREVTWGNLEQKLLGHELAHCLHILHHEENPNYGNGGYEKSFSNYMSGLGDAPFGSYVPNLYFYDWQWGSFKITTKFTGEKNE
ncbi:MAG: hypothetical protein ACFFAN_17325, partial [Promethearchaeota archaeon]